ncbi:MAG: hypothetical protein HOP11_04995 [Saprospiraceae bacterium]|nr:hypothetical protein [Saprospiraceae bacterium]
MDKRSIYLIVGFILFTSSIVGFILNLAGVSLSIFKPLDNLGHLTSTIVKFILMTIGICLVYFAKMVRRKY